MPAPLQGLSDVPWYRSGLVSLAVVLGVIVVVTLLIRRLLPSVRAMSSGAIEILGRNHLAPKQSLTLVRVGRRIVLVGVTPDRISTLCVIDNPHEVAELAGAVSAKGKSGFEKVLGEAATAFGGPDTELGVLAGGPSARLAQAKGELQGLMARLRSLQEQT
jgi:flagellar protein FliO/FliZ